MIVFHHTHDVRTLTFCAILSINARYHGFAKLGQVSPLPVLI